MSPRATRRLIQVRPDWHPQGAGRQILNVSPEEYDELIGTQANTGEYFIAPDNESVRNILTDRANRILEEEVEGRSTIGTAGRAALDSATFGISDWAINSLADDEELERDTWEAQRIRDPLANLGGALGGALAPWGAPGVLARGAGGLASEAISLGIYSAGLSSAGRARTIGQMATNLGIAGNPALYRAGSTAAEVGMIRAPAIITGRALGAAAGETASGVIDALAQSESDDEFWTNVALVAGLGIIGGTAGLLAHRGITRATRVGTVTRPSSRFASGVERNVDGSIISTSRRSISDVAEEAGGSAERALGRALQDIDRTVEPSIGARLSEALGWGRQRTGVLSGDAIASPQGLRRAQRFNNAADEASSRLTRIVSDAEDTIRGSISTANRSITDLGRSAAARSAPSDVVGTIRDSIQRVAESSGIPGGREAAASIARSAGRGSDAQLTSILRFREQAADTVINGTTPAARARAAQSLAEVDNLISNPLLGDFGAEVSKGIERLNVLNNNLSDINKVFGKGDDIAKSLKAIAQGGGQANYERILADIFSDSGRRRIWGDNLPSGIDDIWQDAMDLESAALWSRSKADISKGLGIGDIVDRAKRGSAVIGALAGGRVGALVGVAADLGPAAARFAFDPFFRVAIAEKYMSSLSGMARRMNVVGLKIKGTMRGTEMPGGYAGLAAMRAVGTEERRNSIQSIFLGDNREEKEAAYQEVLDNLDSIAQDPMQLFDMLERENQGLQEFGPEAVARVTNSQIQQIAALKSLVPPTSDQRFLLPGMKKLPPNEAEMDKFLEAAAVIDDPVFALEMLANGVLSNTSARALERGFPELYQKVAGDVFTEYTNMVQEGDDVNYQYINQLSILFGLPLDPSHDAQMIYRLQQNGAQTAEQERSIRSRETMTRQVSNRMAAQAQTESQRLNQ